MKFLLYILVLVIIICSGVKSEELQTVNKKKFRTLLFVSAGMPFSSGSSDFFSVYNNEFQGTKSDYKIAPLIGGGMKLRFEGNYRLGAQFHYLQARLRDVYEEIVHEIDNSGVRSYGQTLELNDIPIIFTGEYMPYISQFRTYVGGGIGFLMRNVSWNETIHSSILFDRRTGGKHYDATDIYPIFKIYSGVELGFDKMSDETFLGSLIIEASYNYAVGSTDYFLRAKSQFVPENERLSQKYNMLPGYLIISLALTFNFNKPA